jgi:hypothetical protein
MEEKKEMDSTTYDKKQGKNPCITGVANFKYDDVDSNYTTRALIDELFFCLCSVNAFTIDGNTKEIRISHKYYDQAEWLIYRVPIWKPAPHFIINISDLTAKLKKELEDLISTPDTLEKILIKAVGRIFENVDFRYYHLSVAKNLAVRLVP